MTRLGAIAILLTALVVFVAADINARPQPDHYALEQWRLPNDSTACAPCGAVCPVEK